MAEKVTWAYFLKRSKEFWGDTHDYTPTKEFFRLGLYKNTRTKIPIKCKVPGHGIFRKPYSQYMTYHQGCQKCGRLRQDTSRKHTWKSFFSKVNKKCPNHRELFDFSVTKEYFTSGKYKAGSDIPIKCNVNPEHGIFYKKLTSFLNDGQGCKECAFEARGKISAIKRKKSQEDWQDCINSIYNNTVVLKTEIQQYNTLVESYCTVHKHTFTRTLDNLCKGTGCDLCRGTGLSGMSSYDKWLSDTFGNLLDYHTKNRIFENKALSVDGYSSQHKLAIELNGVYWHGDLRDPTGSRPREKHLEKTLEAKQKGIKLLHFWDYEVDEKEKIVKSIINHHLGLNRKLYARKLELREPTLEEAKKFLDANHLQGYCPYSYAIGLWSKKKQKFACLMTFGKPRFNKDYQWELLRFCNKTGLSVVGGASRLFKAFVRTKQPDNCLSYADLRYSYGNMYRKLGFSFLRRSTPNYQWVRGSNRYSRYQCQKHKLSKLLGDEFDPELSEDQNMRNAGYYKVWDCGNLVYAWDLNK